jgi:site-specific recombinase XerD
VGSFRNAQALYLDELRARHASPASLRQARTVLPRLFSHLSENGVREPRAVSEGDLVSFGRRLQRSPGRRGTALALWSQRAYLGVVRGFFATLHARGLLLINPAAALSLPTPRTLPRLILTEAQAERLMATPPATDAYGQRDRAILETLYGAGLRQAECLRLDVGDVDLFEATLLVRDGKGRKDRRVPLPCRAAEALDVYLRVSRFALIDEARESALFLSKYGRRLSSTQLRNLVKRHGRAAGIPQPLSPHVLRHTCATHLLRGGADIRHVQTLLGHERIETTALYTRVLTDDLRQVLLRCHPRERATITARSRKWRQ